MAKTPISQSITNYKNFKTGNPKNFPPIPPTPHISSCAKLPLNFTTWRLLSVMQTHKVHSSNDSLVCTRYVPNYDFLSDQINVFKRLYLAHSYSKHSAFRIKVLVKSVAFISVKTRFENLKPRRHRRSPFPRTVNSRVTP